MILGRLRKFNIKPWILQIIAAITAIYGLVALVKRNFLSYITLRMHFVNFNYEEPIIYYELDLFSILILAIFVGYYIQKKLIKGK